jgi:hypothetical protein
MDPKELFRGISIPGVRIPNLKNSSFKDQMNEINKPYTAENIFLQLVQQIRRFEQTLDKEHEVGMQLVCFGQSIQFSVARMGYMNPSIIWFDGGLPDGSNVQLVQHVNQISFLLIAVKRQDPERPKSLIGFCRPSSQNERGFQEFDPSAEAKE